MDELSARCVDFRRYLRQVVQPACDEFRHKLDSDQLHLHDVVANAGIISHAIDYMRAASVCAGRSEKRYKMIVDFDGIHAVEGARFLNHKFMLANLVNNACKHVELDKKVHPNIDEVYGGMGFRNLKEIDGQVYFRAKDHRFNFGRVVLRPIFDVFDGVEFETVADVIDFIDGNYSVEGVCDPEYDEDDPATAIDRMIDYCHPLCLDCGEDSDECECEKYRYPQGSGECNPDYDEEFDFDRVMSQISGSHRP